MSDIQTIDISAAAFVDDAQSDIAYVYAWVIDYNDYDINARAVSTTCDYLQHTLLDNVEGLAVQDIHWFVGRTFPFFSPEDLL